MKCPRCGIGLGPTRFDWMHACARCGGVFAAKHGPDLDARAAEAAAEASLAAKVRASSAPLALCPVCHARTERQLIAAVEVDECGAHGTWFDRGEVEAVMAAGSAAGPRRAKVAAAVGAVAAAGGAVALSQAVGQQAGNSVLGDLTRSGVETAAEVAVDVALDVGVEGLPVVVDAAGEVAGAVVEFVAGLLSS